MLFSIVCWVFTKIDYILVYKIFNLKRSEGYKVCLSQKSEFNYKSVKEIQGFSNFLLFPNCISEVLSYLSIINILKNYIVSQHIFTHVYIYMHLTETYTFHSFDHLLGQVYLSCYLFYTLTVCCLLILPFNKWFIKCPWLHIYLFLLWHCFGAMHLSLSSSKLDFCFKVDSHSFSYYTNSCFSMLF